MKNISILKTAFAAMISSLLLFSCNEKVKVDVTEEQAPVITSFSPDKGKVGTQIKISGENLQTVDSVFIGGGLSQIKYRVNSQELIAVVTAHSKTGTILVRNAQGSSESENTFTVEYLQPEITECPQEGSVGDQLLFKGNNLETISKVIFGKNDQGEDVLAEIAYQTEKELLVIIPFVKEADIKLCYESETGEQYIDNIPFTIILPQPTFEPIAIEEDTEGNALTVYGTNLHLVDSIVFGDMTGKIISQNSDSITVVIPEVADDVTLTVKACYYGTEEYTIIESFKINNLLLLTWKDITLGARESGLPSFFNPVKGLSYTACDIAGAGDMSQNYDVYMYTDYSSSTVIIGNPANGKNKFKNFKCEGVNLPSTNFPNVVKFRTIDDETYINLVKNNELTVIPDTITNILGTPGTSDMLYDNGKLNEDQLTRSYKIGDVIFFALFDENSSPASFGFIHVKNVDFKTSEDGSAEKTSTITFDCYFQK